MKQFPEPVELLSYVSNVIYSSLQYKGIPGVKTHFEDKNMMKFVVLACLVAAGKDSTYLFY